MCSTLTLLLVGLGTAPAPAPSPDVRPGMKPTVAEYSAPPAPRRRQVGPGPRGVDCDGCRHCARCDGPQRVRDRQYLARTRSSERADRDASQPRHPRMRRGERDRTAPDEPRPYHQAVRRGAADHRDGWYARPRHHQSADGPRWHRGARHRPLTPNRLSGERPPNRAASPNPRISDAPQRVRNWSGVHLHAVRPWQHPSAPAEPPDRPGRHRPIGAGRP